MWELGNVRSCIIITWLLNFIRLHYCASHCPCEPCLVQCTGRGDTLWAAFLPSPWYLTCYWQVLCINLVLSTSPLFPQWLWGCCCHSIVPFRCIFHHSLPGRQVWHCSHIIAKGFEATCGKVHNWCPLILSTPSQSTFGSICQNSIAFF